MEPRTVARAIALGRVAVGTAFLAAPERAARTWVGRDAHRGGTQVFIAGLGARDLALGLGVLSGLASGRARPWLAASAAADAADLVATLRARGRIPGAGAAMVALVAGAATAAGTWLARQDDL